MLVLEPGRPEVYPFAIVPENIRSFLSLYRIKKILEFGTTVFTKIEFRGADSGRTGGFSCVEVIATHGTFKMA